VRLALESDSQLFVFIYGVVAGPSDRSSCRDDASTLLDSVLAIAEHDDQSTNDHNDGPPKQPRSL
jgi:hypothetical protein